MASEFDIPGVDYDHSVPIMDREQIDMLLMVDDDEEGSAALVRELYDLFLAESNEKFSELGAVCASGDTVELRKIVHFVAGSAGNLGLARLSGFFRAVEQALDEGRLTDLSGCPAPMLRAFEAGCVGFRTEFDI